jgi:hypothetical protein
MNNVEHCLGWLNNGTRFKIPGLNCYRNLRLVRSTDCSAVIAGERQIEVSGKKIWSQIPSGYTISPNTVVDIS